MSFSDSETIATPEKFPDSQRGREIFTANSGLSAFSYPGVNSPRRIQLSVYVINAPRL
jgi:hypothetical protein